MDRVLQGERVTERGKETYVAPLGSLPDGTMIDVRGDAYLIWRKRLYKWSFGGYEEDKVRRAPDTPVHVLTPQSIVRAFASGFVPHVDVSAFW